MQNDSSKCKIKKLYYILFFNHFEFCIAILIFELFCYRQFEIKCCAFVFFGFKPNFTLIGVYNGLDDKKAEPGADCLMLHHVIGAEKLLKNIFLLGLGNADASVLDTG